MLCLQFCCLLIPPIFLHSINKLSVIVKVLLAWQESSNVGTVRGGVSPTVRDRGKCSWPNVHSPAPPSPTACTERVGGFIHILQTDTLTLLYKLDFMHERI